MASFGRLRIAFRGAIAFSFNCSICSGMPLTVRDKPALFSRGCFFCKPYAMVIWRQLPAHHDAMHKVRRQLPALAALVDLWWQGVRQDLEPFLLAPKWQQGYTSASSLWSIGRTRSLGRGVI